MNARVRVDLAAQRLVLEGVTRTPTVYLVATSKYGAGEQRNSLRTPRGRHVIRAKIGAEAALNAVFVGRRLTGEIHTPELAAAHPARDYILTRILWLCGTEPGRNRFKEVDTQSRYIYIHGTPDDVVMGVPSSIGCIRMRNCDVIELFDRVATGTVVNID